MMQDDDDDDDDDNDDPMILNNRAKNHTSERTIVPWTVIFWFQITLYVFWKLTILLQRMTKIFEDFSKIFAK